MPQAFELSDFCSHLTAAEKKQLAARQVVEKTHVSYWRFHPQQVYWQGQLRAAQTPDKKLAFSRLGHWQQFDEHGGLVWNADFRQQGRWLTSNERIYYPAGVLFTDILRHPVLLNGDSLLEQRSVNFRYGSETDTLYVERWYFKDGKYLRPARRTFDLAGRRPVPKNWNGQPEVRAKQ
ncbi:hypothetical protein GCM10027594_21500 [Hymenobacter agri]